jgi:flagellar basal body-associated protein FliL
MGWLILLVVLLIGAGVAYAAWRLNRAEAALAEANARTADARAEARTARIAEASSSAALESKELSDEAAFDLFLRNAHAGRAVRVER